MVQGLHHIVVGVVIDDPDLTLHIGFWRPGWRVEPTDTLAAQNLCHGVIASHSAYEVTHHATHECSWIPDPSNERSGRCVFEDLLELEDRRKGNGSTGEVGRSCERLPHLHAHSLHTQDCLSNQGILDLYNGTTPILNVIKSTFVSICSSKSFNLSSFPCGVLRHNSISSVLSQAVHGHPHDVSSHVVDHVLNLTLGLYNEQLPRFGLHLESNLTVGLHVVLVRLESNAIELDRIDRTRLNLEDFLILFNREVGND